MVQSKPNLSAFTGNMFSGKMMPTVHQNQHVDAFNLLQSNPQISATSLAKRCAHVKHRVRMGAPIVEIKLNAAKGTKQYKTLMKGFGGVTLCFVKRPYSKNLLTKSKPFQHVLSFRWDGKSTPDHLDISMQTTDGPGSTEQVGTLVV